MKSTIKVILIVATLTGFTAAKEPNPADYPERISIVGTHPVSLDSGHVSINCKSKAVGQSIDTNCSGREVYRSYTIITGIAPSSTLRFEMVRLNWMGEMKTSGGPAGQISQTGILGLTGGVRGDTIKPGDYFFRFVDGNTIEVLNGKKKIRFVVIATYCTQDLSGLMQCKAGEKLNVVAH